jgi:hypothetical protein
VSKPSEQEANECQIDPRLAGGAEPLIVLAESAVVGGGESQAKVRSTTHRLGMTWNPGGGRYCDQSICSGGRLVGDPVALGAMDRLHGLDPPADGLLDPVLPFATAVVPGVEPAELHPWQPGADGFLEHPCDPVTIHDVGRMDIEGVHQPLRVDEHLPLAAHQFLGAVVAPLAPHARGLDRWAVDGARAWLLIAAQAAALTLPQVRVHALPRPSYAPRTAVITHGRPRRPLAW